MTLVLRGDFAKLKSWTRKIEGASRSKALKDLADNLAEEALDLVAEGFANESDPYGKRWKAKKKPDGRSVLVGKTARLRRGWHRKRVSSKGFRIGPAVDYAQYHQESTSRMVARKMVPDAGRLPGKWSKAFNGIAQEFLRQHFR